MHARRQLAQSANAHKAARRSVVRPCASQTGTKARASQLIHAPSGREERIMMGCMVAQHAAMLSKPLSVRLLRR